jgi:hypothetical protein
MINGLNGAKNSISGETALELIYSVISIMGPSMFSQEFIAPDLISKNKPNESLRNLIASMGEAWGFLDEEIIFQAELIIKPL